MDAEVEPAEADRRDEERDSCKARDPRPPRANSTREEIRKRSVQGD
jgi:hypothetical protein